MAEYFIIYAEIHKQKREERKAKYEPILKQIGIHKPILFVEAPIDVPILIPTHIPIAIQ